MAPATDQLTAPPAAPSLPPGYDPNTGTVPATSQGTAPAATPTPLAAPGTTETLPAWERPAGRIRTAAEQAQTEKVGEEIAARSQHLVRPEDFTTGWINNIAPSLNPDFVAQAQAGGYDDLGLIFGKPHADYLRDAILHGYTPEVFARAAAQSLGDWEAPVNRATEALSPLAHGYATAAKEAQAVGDVAEASKQAYKAHLTGLLGAAGNVGFSVQQTKDLIDNWDKMTPAERVMGLGGLVGQGLLAGVGLHEAGATDKVRAAANHLRETGKTFIDAAKEEGKRWATATAPEGEPEAGHIPLGEGKLDDLGTRLPDLQTAEMRNPKVTFGRTGGPFGRAVDITHQVLRQNEAEANAPTIEHRENVATFGSGSEAPQEMSQVRLKQGDKTVGRLNYVINPATKTASVKGIAIEDPKLQGKGYAQQMYLAAADKARAAGATSLTSDLQGTTTMEAARAWDKLQAKGHPVEKIPSKPGSPGYVMDLTKPSPLPQYGQAASEQGNLPGQKIQLGDLQAKYVGRETPQIKTPETALVYHPDLQKMADKYGVVNSPSGGPEASFIAPDGKFIRLPAGVEHPQAIDFVTANKPIVPRSQLSDAAWMQEAQKGLDTRVGFLNDTGAIRIRISNDRAGTTAHISVPKQGVTPKQIPAVQQAIASAGRNGNVVMERADVTPETKDQLTMTKDFPRPGDAAQYLRQIQAHPDQHPESDLMTNERQSPLKEPYAIEITGKDGTTRTESVDAFSSKDALKTAQKKFPDATEWASVKPGARTPSTEYSVPTGKLLSTPPVMGKSARDFYGRSKEDAAAEDAAATLRTMYHELGGHGMIGLKEGMTPKGILRHTNPDAHPNTRAAASWDASDLYIPGTRQFKPDKVDAVVKNFMGGPAADEVFSGAPRAANHNFDYTVRGSDGYQAYNALRDAGYNHDDALARMHEMVDENKEYLTKPEVSDVIKENVGVREPGLSTQYHHSPERMQNMHAEIQRRIKANGANTEDINNGAAGGGGTQDHPAVVARGEGGISETAGQVPGEVAKTPAAEAAPEVTPQQQVITEMSKLGDPDKAQMQLAERAGRVRIKALETAPGARQQGHAAALLSKLADSADKHGVTLELTASPYAPMGFTDKILDSDELQAFYKRHGFVMEPGHDPAYGYMIREPKSPETAPEVNPHDLVERAQQALAAGDKKTAASLLAQARAALQSSELTTAEVKKPSEPWAETAGKAMAENGAFTINPRTGEIPNTGHWLEAGPELRQVSDKPSTPAEIQKFAAQRAVKKMLAKYPELQIGGYKNDAGKYELNLSASSADPEAARAVATKLDQESTWDAGGQKLNPAGGKNQKTSFPDYPMDERLRDLAPKTPGNTISTRYPTAVAATEDPLRHDLVLGPEHLENNPALTEKYAKAVQNVPGFKPPEGATAIQTVRAFIDHVKDNLKALYNQSTPEEQARNKEWYDGAHQLTKDLADKHGYTHMQTAGVTAALSPQKDWDMNVSLAKRLTDIVKNHADEKATPEMIQKGKDIVSQTQEVNPKANAALQKMLPKIKGKSLNELTDPTQRAAWVRLYDEAHNPREFEKIGPDGKPQGLRTNIDGTPTRAAWGSFNEINKALSILKDGSRENISRMLGGAHKVRSFYNNIIDPNSTRGDVTIDTHAVAAGLLRPLSGFHTEVKQNFNSPNSAVAGLKGTYPLYHAAYTEAAKELDIPHPRMLQSVVWEKIRNIFPAEFKTAENNDAINAIWKEKEDGKITADQARQRILDYAESHRPVSEGQQAGADQGQLPVRGVHGESAEGHERNRVSARTPVEDDTSFNFGANAPEELPPTPQPKPKKMKGAVSAMSLLSGLKKAGSKPK